METARRDVPDLITLDLVMPGMSGWEALKLMKEDPELQQIPVIVVSVVADEERTGSVFGSVDLLTKPVDPQKLLTVLRRNLREMQGKTVLVVEDEAETRALIKEHLQQAGLKTVLAANGVEAEAALEEGHPALIVLDLVMPVMDGTAFLQRLRSNPARVEIPVVICTGKALSPEEKARLLAQATEILGKGEGFRDALLRAVRAYVSLPPRRQGRGRVEGGETS
jgi:CheY-like chemotaxis protein